jgi:TRAP-type C4-dicarboxylate transport system permease small subunit
VIMDTQRMVIIDWPMSIVFGACTFGLLLMTLRSIQVAIQNWRAGTSPLMAVHDEGRHQ